MKTTLFLLATTAKLASSMPARQAPALPEFSEAFQIDKPSNYYIEKDLDKTKSWTPGGTVTIVRYGPYEVASMGMADNVWQYNVKAPCEDCYIVAMQGDLQFEDGRSAFVEDGAWLHHSVLYTGLGWTPGSKTDLVCSNTLLSAFLGWPHRIFASGNERTPVRLNTKYKYGISVEKGDYFHLLYDLVNVGPQTRKFYLAFTYEWVPKSTPGYKEARMVWTDITGCGASEATPLEGAYEMRSPGWTSTVGGVMLSTLGHVHDGGTYTTLFVNGKPVCRSDQFYGTKPQYFEKDGVTNLSSDVVSGGSGKEMAHGHSGSGGAHAEMNGKSKQSQPNMKAMEHISEVSSCVNFGILKPGDFVELRATYNTTQHYMNRNMMHDHGGIMNLLATPNDPKYAPIMGINPLYIGVGQMEL